MIIPPVISYMFFCFECDGDICQIIIPCSISSLLFFLAYFENPSTEDYDNLNMKGDLNASLVLAQRSFPPLVTNLETIARHSDEYKKRLKKARSQHSQQDVIGFILYPLGYVTAMIAPVVHVSILCRKTDQG